MKFFIILLFFVIPFLGYGQYLEEFNLADRGLISAPGTFNLVGVNWTIEVGSGPNPGGIAATDYFKTEGGALVARDSDVEYCFYTPILDITIPATSGFSIPFNAPNFDSPSIPPTLGNDYIQVDYRVNGGTWVGLGNQFGGGARTVETPIGSMGDQSFSGTITQPSTIVGSTLQIRVCVLNTNTAENISLFSISVPQTGTSVLPVKWANIEANKKEGGNEIRWKTFSEVNNEKFEIERSFDDGNDFNVIGTLLGAGNSSISKEYTFWDNHDHHTSSIIYYRVKQTDFDGKYDYSPMVAVRNDLGDYSEFSVSPNPFSDYLNIISTNDKSENNATTIMNSNGVIINELLNFNGAINTSQFVPGIYFIKLPDGQTKKLVKM